MRRRSVKEIILGFGIRKALHYLDSDPEKNIPRILNWLIRIDKEDKYVGKQAKLILSYMVNKDGNWYRLIKSLYTDIDDEVRKKLFENFIVNGVFLGGKRQNKARKKYQCNVPWAILLDPTSGCNLHCIGCWSAEYGNKLNMSFDTLDAIITQGKNLGVYFYIYSGGEPLVRKRDIIRLCEKHQDCAFLAFTNGTLIDEEFAREMLRVKNFVPAISAEGFEEETDYRRGGGTYKAVEKAMDLLRGKRLPFGISCCYTSKNTEIIGSEEYFDYMIEKGARFAWFFTYMPVGAEAVPELLVTAKQREFMYHQIRSFRESKPIFTMDFWNDGEYVKGCIAGGRRYLHINANGDIEPCAFIHYSDSNIYQKSILEALKSPLFMEYHKNQPFNSNMLRPCPLLDNQGRLADMVEKSGAKSTDLKNPEDVRSLTEKCIPAADWWEPVADRLWEESHECISCDKCRRCMGFLMEDAFDEEDEEDMYEEARGEGTKAEEAKPEEDRGEEEVGGETKVEEAKLEEDRGEEDMVGETKAEEDMGEETKAEKVKPEEDRAEEDVSEKTKTGEDKDEETVEEVKAEEDKDEETKVEEVKAEQGKADEAKSEEVKAEQGRADEAKSEEVKEEGAKSEKDENKKV